MATLKMHSLFSERIASLVAKQLAAKIPELSCRKKFEGQRKIKIREKSIEYMHKTFEQINNAGNIKYSVPKKKEIDESEEEHFIWTQKHRHSKHNLQIFRRNSKDVESGSSKNIKNYQKKNRNKNSGFNIDKKKVIKLKTDSDEDTVYGDYVQKLREKKIRLAEALNQFQKSQNDLIKTSIQHPSKIAVHQLKPIITSYEGEIIKSDRKNLGSSKKQNLMWSQKNKVKPLFRLKESMYTMKDISKFAQEPQFLKNEPQTSVISSMRVYDLEDKNKQNNSFNIKSIMDIYASKNAIDGKRSRKIINLK